MNHREILQHQLTFFPETHGYRNALVIKEGNCYSLEFEQSDTKVLGNFRQSLDYLCDLLTPFDVDRLKELVTLKVSEIATELSMVSVALKITVTKENNVTGKVQWRGLTISLPIFSLGQDYQTFDDLIKGSLLRFIQGVR